MPPPDRTTAEQPPGQSPSPAEFRQLETHSFSSVQLTDPVIFAYIRAALRAWVAVRRVTVVYVANDFRRAKHTTRVPGRPRRPHPPGVFDMGIHSSAPIGSVAATQRLLSQQLAVRHRAGDVIIQQQQHLRFPDPAGSRALTSSPTLRAAACSQRLCRD